MDTGSDVRCTLYVGGLSPLVQAEGLQEFCRSTSAKIIMDVATGASAGYGFVEFQSRDCAQTALDSLNGRTYCGLPMRVNWAQPIHRKEDSNHQHLIFVGDIANDVSDEMLRCAFERTAGPASDARVMRDKGSGWSKGYGFVSFLNKEDATTAIEKMQGVHVGSRAIRVAWAKQRQDDGSPTRDVMAVDRADPANTNVYVGNIAPDTCEAELVQHFSAYGPVVEVKVHQKGGYGFVKFDQHESAVRAIVLEHRKSLHERVLKCSWGKCVTPAPNASAPRSIQPPATSIGGSGHGSVDGWLGLAPRSPPQADSCSDEQDTACLFSMLNAVQPLSVPLSTAPDLSSIPGNNVWGALPKQAMWEPPQVLQQQALFLAQQQAQQGLFRPQQQALFPPHQLPHDPSTAATMQLLQQLQALGHSQQPGLGQQQMQQQLLLHHQQQRMAAMRSAEMALQALVGPTGLSQVDAANLISQMVAMQQVSNGQMFAASAPQHQPQYHNTGTTTGFDAYSGAYDSHSQYGRMQ